MPGADEEGGGGEGEGGARPPPFAGMADPFRDVRGEGPGGDLMGPASLGLCCAVCCVCTLVSLLVAYLAWAYWTVATSQESASTECGTSSSLWVFCLMVTILVPILGCVVSIISYFTVSLSTPRNTHPTPSRQLHHARNRTLESMGSTQLEGKLTKPSGKRSKSLGSR